MRVRTRAVWRWSTRAASELLDMHLFRRRHGCADGTQAGRGRARTLLAIPSLIPAMEEIGEARCCHGANASALLFSCRDRAELHACGGGRGSHAACTKQGGEGARG